MSPRLSYLSFSSQVSLDSVVANELGDPRKLQRPGFSYANAGDEPAQGGPRLLHLQFDLTPLKFVGMVVTEVGLIPPTAVPALLREYRKDAGDLLANDL